MRPDGGRSQVRPDTVSAPVSALRPDTSAGRTNAAEMAFSCGLRAWHERCSALVNAACRPDKNMIRDTSAQDRVVHHAPSRRQWVVMGGVGAAVLGALSWVGPTVAKLSGAGSSVNASSLRIASVKRGTLVRDISAQGKVVAAVSPTLYTNAAGTVNFDVHAGDKVDKDQVLAEVDSPELKNKLEQEQATFDSLKIEVE